MPKTGLKKCPWCKKIPLIDKENREWCYCNSKRCVLYGLSFFITRWNRRGL